jgi:hypothetical protein
VLNPKFTKRLTLTVDFFCGSRADTNLIWALLFEIVVFHNMPDPLSVLGGTIIVLSAVWVALSKEQSSRALVREEKSSATKSEEGSVRHGSAAVNGGKGPLSREGTGNVLVLDSTLNR